jgi:HD-GYP domain-containing protein (c-di-GMP phosphodiesterase class II)
MDPRHHERADGRGYPAGLTEAAIPEGAAILAVADAFDVMTATRIYSAARTREDALAECERLVGAQFASAPRRRLGRAVRGRAAHSVCPVIRKPCARSAGVTTRLAKRRP